jgi:NAD+ synthase
MKKTIQILTKNLKLFFQKNNFQKAVVGVSGGVDSACTLKLGIKALGKENITALLMPESGVSKTANLEDARNLVKSEGVEYFEISLKPFIKNFEQMPWKHSDYADMNIRARLRMAILYHFANSRNAIVLGTGNKTEVLLGYGTKYGDFGVDVEVLGVLWKTEVFHLAKELGLPEQFYTKTPSAELHEGQTDEEEIGVSYEIIDRILQNAEKDEKQVDDEKTVQKILNMVEINKHKTRNIPVIDR